MITPEGKIENPYSNFIALSRYARWLEDENRRETWQETVTRYVKYMGDKLADKGTPMPAETQQEIYDAILNLEVMPSMRSLMTSGEALDRENIAGYNCAFVAVDNLRAFDEALYIMMNGTGLGFSVESKYVDKLPVIPAEFYKTESTIVVHDSKIGWAKAYKELISFLMSGHIPAIDVSRVRPAGARLKTFGGRASGPQPLIDLFDFTIASFKRAAGRKLKPIECHDIMCKVGAVVVVGGVRRSAEISLSDIDDYDMARAKAGNWWENNSQRSLANNSAVYQAKPSSGQFLKEWKNLYDSKSGERGIVNMDGIRKHIDSFGIRDSSKVAGMNPCHTGDTLMLTDQGLRTISDLSYGSGVEIRNAEGKWVASGEANILNGDGKFVPAKFWSNGFRQVYDVELTNGMTIGLTEDHIIEVMERKSSKGKYDISTEVKVRDLEPGMAVQPFVSSKLWNGGKNVPNAKLYGLAFGDGYAKRDGSAVYFKTQEREVIDFINAKNVGGGVWKVAGLKREMEGHGFDFSPLPVRELPDDILTWSVVSVREFLCGLYSANGSNLANYGRIVLKATNKNTVQMVQRILSSIGISSYITTNDPVSVEWSNGTYVSKRSYDLNTSQHNKFLNDIGFLHDHKMLRTGEEDRHSKVTKVRSVTYRGIEEVFDFNEPETHWGWANGFKSHNCAEILLRSGQFCVGPETPMITRNGIFNISSLRDQEVEVWNGSRWSRVTVRKTRDSGKMVRVTFGDGSYLDTTPDHRFSVKNRFETEYREVQAQDLMSEKYVLSSEPYSIVSEGGESIENAYTLGFAVGDGYSYNGKVGIDLYGDKDIDCPVVGIRHKRVRPKGYSVDKVRVMTDIDPKLFSSLRVDFRQIAKWDSKSALDFFAGLADADGSQANNGIRIYISDETRARDAQLVLTKFGVKSSVNLAQRAGTETNKGIRKRDLWYLQIVDAHLISTHRLNTKDGSAAKSKGLAQTIRSVEPIEDSESYCFTEHEFHKAVFGNVLTYQCNLTEVVVSPDDNLDDLKRKVRIATILGTYQATLTDFKYLRKMWQNNTEEERLLGVSLTGIMGHRVLGGVDDYMEYDSCEWYLDEILEELRLLARETNEEWAERFGIPVSAGITCTKPSGTVSQLVGSSSGIHPWYAPYYIRTVRGDNKDPLTKLMKDEGIPNEPDVMNPENTTVFSFPIKAPEGVLYTSNLTAIEHLELWKTYRTEFTEHNPSVTISVGEDEWLDVGAWVFKNFDYIGGVSFLPRSEHTYKQAPYQEISEEAYNEAVANFPKEIKWDLLSAYELEDNTTGTQEPACVSGNCELI